MRPFKVCIGGVHAIKKVSSLRSKTLWSRSRLPGYLVGHKKNVLCSDVAAWEGQVCPVSIKIGCLKHLTGSEKTSLLSHFPDLHHHLVNPIRDARNWFPSIRSSVWLCEPHLSLADSSGFSFSSHQSLMESSRCPPSPSSTIF